MKSRWFDNAVNGSARFKQDHHLHQNAIKDFFSSKDAGPCAGLSLDRCLIYISPLCFITFIASVTLHLTAFTLSARRVARLNRLYVQVFEGNNLCEAADYNGVVNVIHFAITHGWMFT